MRKLSFSGDIVHLGVGDLGVGISAHRGCKQATILHSALGRGRRVVGSIRNVGAGNPGSLPVWNANSGIPLKVD